VQAVNSPWTSAEDFVNNLRAQYEAGLITEEQMGAAIGQYFSERASRPGWAESIDNFTIEERDNGEYFATFSYTEGSFAERVDFAIDPNDFSGLGFSKQLYFVEEIGANNRFELDFIEGGYSRSTAIFGDLVGSVTVRYTYAEPIADPITNPSGANLNAPTQGGGDTYNTSTWDDFEADAYGWTATDHDFRIGNLSAPALQFGFQLDIPMHFAANNLNPGDQMEVSVDYSTFGQPISGFVFFPETQPTLIPEQTDPVSATLIRPTTFTPGIPTTTLELAVV